MDTWLFRIPLFRLFGLLCILLILVEDTLAGLLLELDWGIEHHKGNRDHILVELPFDCMMNLMNLLTKNILLNYS